MKPYDSTCVIDLRELAAYRPVTAPTPLTWAERRRIASDRLRAVWARFSVFEAALMAVGTPESAETHTITVVVPTRTLSPAQQRDRAVLGCIATPALFLLAVMLFASIAAKPIQASTTRHIAPHSTQYACHNIGHNVACAPAGYCARIHYPQQDSHCKTLLPPKKKGSK